jgi:RNA polymerase sigma-70 factor (ECF subfamily)
MNSNSETSPDITTLIKQIETGDPEAFRLLFERYKNLVFRSAYLMLDDAPDAEDVLQEVFVLVHRHLSSYRPEKGAFTTWLYAITANQCRNRRRVKRVLTIPLSWIQDFRGRANMDEASDLDRKQPILQALDKLSPKVRDVVILRYYNELSYAEIAEVLAVPIGTVQSRLNWGLKKLRQELEANDPDILIDDVEVIQ